MLRILIKKFFRKCDTTTRFLIFHDDVNYVTILKCDGRTWEIVEAMRLSNFCWYTLYRDISTGMKLYMPKETRVQPYEYHRVHLTDSLRYTGSIHALLNHLHARILGKYAGAYCSPGFGPGTRIIGEKPQFVSVN